MTDSASTRGTVHHTCSTTIMMEYNEIQRCMLGCVEVNLLHFVLISSGAICNMCNVPCTQNLSHHVTVLLLFPLLYALLSMLHARGVKLNVLICVIPPHHVSVRRSQSIIPLYFVRSYRDTSSRSNYSAYSQR